MRSLIVIGLSLLMANFNMVKANIDTVILRDPFAQQNLIPCNEHTNILLQQIQSWQFKGIIVQVDHSYRQIWLASQSQWLSITDNIVPNILFPWQMQSTSADNIVWQANLPEYCHDKILWTMRLNE